MLSVQGRPCLVVGGGGVALRKVDGLLSDGAVVTVVAPEPIAHLETLAERGEIQLERRSYRGGEARAFALVFAATDDRDVNRSVYDDANAAGIWVNVADDPELCSFHLPARVRRGPMQLVVASAGEAPFAVRRLRQLLERRFGNEWGEWVKAAARFRKAVLGSGLERRERESRYDAFFAATVDQERLIARVPTKAEEEQLRPGDTVSPERWEPESAEQPEPSSGPEPREAVTRPGLVSLVGAGPGDAGLLTLRGRQRLLTADVVVWDRLAATALPTDLPSHVELRAVGKVAGHHPVPQSEITKLLVRLASQGKRVVRLKGGDPYVFGRGGEEAEAIAAAGIPFEVIPCVTAGVAVPTYAGIPVTYRREAVRLTFVTAHEAIKSDGPQVRWDLIAADPHATLVGYMGVTALPKVVEILLAAGLAPDTPSAVIQSGTTSAQRVVRSPVEALPRAVEEAGIKPPGLFVIGPTLGHADRLDWFGQRPLCGHRLLLVSPAGSLGEELELAGAEVVEVPLPVTPAARVVMDALPLTGCILRNPEEVDALDEERDGPGFGPDVVAWCLDAVTASRALEVGWKSAEVVERAEVVDSVARGRG